MLARALAEKNCTPCRGGVPPLAADRIPSLLAAIPGWELLARPNRIRRRFRFEDFSRAIEFVEALARLAEDQGHHPDLAIRGAEVDVVLYTHVLRDLHENDFIMAAKINGMAGRWGQP